MPLFSYADFAIPEGIRHEPLVRRIVHPHSDGWPSSATAHPVLQPSAPRTAMCWSMRATLFPAPGAPAKIIRFAPGELQGIFLPHSHPDHRG